MQWGKYIIQEVNGHEVAIMFNALISHCDIGTCHESRGKTVSAGFFAVGAKASENDPDDIDVSCFGKSTTLKLESRKEDAVLLQKVLRPKSRF